MSGTRCVQAGGVAIGGEARLALIAGPCVIASRDAGMALAEALVRLAGEESIPLVFKASYDKANRSSHLSYRGPGLEKGLAILAEIRETFGVPVLTDVHSIDEVRPAAAVVDVLQIPAFLCRQTDLILAAAETGKVVNVKKGQFLAPRDMKQVIAKAESVGNRSILVTERGASFGYNNLVADMRSLLIMKEFGYPVVFDATHSVQHPGGLQDRSGGDGCWAPYLARGAVAVGCDAVFMETYLDPELALSDRENSVPFETLRPLWRELRAIDEVVD